MRETETGESTLHILRILKEERSLSEPEICHKLLDAVPEGEIIHRLQLLIDDGYVKQLPNRNADPSYRITSSGVREIRRRRITATIGFDPSGEE